MEAQEILSDYELERGKPLPSIIHGIVQARLIIELGRLYENKFIIVSEVSLEIGDFSATPDIAIYPLIPIDWFEDRVKMNEPPLLVIEIVSPTQGMQEVEHKIKGYITHGVKSCWLVQPMLSSITVISSEMKPHTCSSSEVTDPVTGISVSLEKIFS
jgi:Uma2 family endonuclease